MKRFILIFTCFSIFYSGAQTLLTDKNGVRLFYKIEQTEKFTYCIGDVSDKNFSRTKINIWKITLGLENGHSGAIVPRGIGIANINVQPNPIKPYSRNYCSYERLENYGPNQGYLDQSLFVWPIRDHIVEEMAPGEVLINTAYLYLYEGQSPKLTNWQFLGYRPKEDFRPYKTVLVNEKVADTGTTPFPQTKTIETKPRVSSTIATRNSKVKKLEVTSINQVEPIKIPAAKRDKKNTTYTLKASPLITSTSKEIETTTSTDQRSKEVFLKCPGEKALEYKEKSNAASDVSVQRAYSWLALYYSYKCECEIGSYRSDQLVNVINNVVDSYVMNTGNVYGKISKVSKCTASIAK